MRPNQFSSLNLSVFIKTTKSKLQTLNYMIYTRIYKSKRKKTTATGVSSLAQDLQESSLMKSDMPMKKRD